MIILIEKSNDKSEVAKRVLSKLGINEVPREISDSVRDKFHKLTNEEKDRLLESLNKETLTKIKDIIDSVQGYTHG